MPKTRLATKQEATYAFFEHQDVRVLNYNSLLNVMFPNNIRVYYHPYNINKVALV